MAWTQEQHTAHAGLLRRKADGFYSDAARASLAGRHAKANRMFSRGLELDYSASTHEARARATSTPVGAITGKRLDKLIAARERYWAANRAREKATRMPDWSAAA